MCPFRDHEPRQGDYPRATVHIGHDRKMRVVGIDPDGDLVGAPGGRVRGPFVEVRSRRGQLCGLRADQTVYCAGSYQAIQIDTRALQRVERVDAVLYKKPFVKTFGIATDRSVIWPQRHPEAGRGTPIEQLGTFASRSSLFERAAQTMKQQPAGVREPQAIHDFGCGFRGEGELVCWGSIRGSTQRVRPPRGAFKALAVGGHSAAAIRASDGALVTWGANPWDSFPPKEGVYRAVRATYLNHCAETVEGRVRCWGGAFPRGFEVPFAPHDYALFDAGVCAIRASGAPLECFGDGLEWEAAR